MKKIIILFITLSCCFVSMANGPIEALNFDGSNYVVTYNNQSPVAVCQNITVSADANCEDVTTIASDFDDGSSDPDGDPLTFTVSPAGPYPLGTTNVTLTVSDGQETDQCSAMITVTDDQAPQVICQDITVELDASGNATITAADVDGGSMDNCGIQSIEIDDDSFDCNDLGTQASNDYALDFDGSNDFVEVGNLINWERDQPFTMETWVFMDDSGNETILGNYKSGELSGIEFRIAAGWIHIILANNTGANALAVRSSTVVPTGSWQHVAVTYDGSSTPGGIELYHNGIAQPKIIQFNSLTSSIQNSNPTWIGSRPGNHVLFFDGRIDELRVWNTERTSGEIQAEMNNTLASSQPGLIAYYPMEDGPGSSTLTDQSSNNFNGTLMDMNPANDWVSGATPVSSGGGASVTLTVTDAAGNQSICQANVTIEDNIDPTITCPADVNISADAGQCGATGVALGSPTTDDNCDGESVSNDAPAFFPVGTTTVTWTVVDVSGNEASCTQTVTVTDDQAPQAICQDITVELDASGNATITAADVDNGSSDNCGIQSMEIDNDSFDCSDLGTQASNDYALDFDGANDFVEVGNVINWERDQPFTMEAWVFMDDSGNETILGNYKSGELSGIEFRIAAGWIHIILANNTGANALAVRSSTVVPTGSWQHVAVTYDGSSTPGGIELYHNGITQPKIIQFNSLTSSIQNSNPTWIGSRPGNHVLFFDGRIDELRVWNTERTSGEIQAEMNNTLASSQPGLIAYYPMEDGPGSSTLTDQSSNNFNGTLTDMNPANDWVSGATPVSSGGGASVTLTVTDAAGNQSICQANVVVEDNIDPTITCPADVNISADAGQCGATGVALGSPVTDDNCDGQTVSNDAPAFFPVGTTTVIWTVVDVAGNQASCTQQVTVTDDEAPSAICQDITVELDATGNAGITPSQVDNGSSDNCGAVTLSLDQNSFDCSDLGMQASNDYSLDFDAVDDFVNVGNVIDWERDQPFTMEAWVFMDDNGNETIFGNYTQSELTGIEFRIAAGWIHLVLSNTHITNALGVKTSTVVPTGSWQHVAVTYDGSSTPGGIELYHNGVPQPKIVQMNTLSSSIQNANPTWIGSRPGNTEILFDGNIDELRVWNTVRTAGQLQVEMNNTLTGNEPGLIAYYPMEDGPGSSTLTDASLSNFNGTLTNMNPATDWEGGAANVSSGSGTSVTLTVTDAAGNQSVCQANVVVEDNIDPTINCPADVNISADAGQCGATGVALGSPVTDDNCDGESVSNDAPVFFPVGTTTVTWTVMDVAGNQASCTQTVTVTDDEAPQAICQDITVELDATGNAGITPSQVDNGSSDNCGVVTLSLDQNSFDCSDLGMQASNDYSLDFDGSNDFVEVGNLINWERDQPFTMEAWVFMDDSGNETILGNYKSGELSGIEFRIAAGWIHIILANNTGANALAVRSSTVVPTGSWQHVAVTYDGSSTPDGIELYHNGIAQPKIIQFNSLTSSIQNSNPTWIGSRPGNHVLFFDGRIDELRVWNTERTSGEIQAEMNNTLASSQPGLIAYYPMEDGPGSSTLTDQSLNNFNGTLTDMNPANDWVSGANAVSSGGGASVTLTVTDAAGNQSICQANVTIEDNIDPTINCPADVNISADAGQCGATGVALGSPVTDDNCGGQTVSNDAPAFFPVGTTTVTWTVVDVAGNQASCTQTVTITDDQAPQAICQDITVELDATGNATITAADVDNGSSDNCGIQSMEIDNDSFDCSDVNVPPFQNYGQVVVYHAGGSVMYDLDDANLVNWESWPSCGQRYISSSGLEGWTWNDNLPSGTTVTAVDIHLSFDFSGTGAPRPYYLNGVNEGISPGPNNGINCTSVIRTFNLTGANYIAGGSNTFSWDFIPSTYALIGATAISNPGIPVVLTVTDNNGNVSTCQANVTVEDNIDPTITCPADVNVSADAGECGATGVALGNPIADDNCGFTVTNDAPASFPLGTTIVTWTIVDVSGNQASCTQTVTVTDDEIPSVACKNISVELDENGNASITPNDVDNGSSDNCGISDISIDITDFTCADVGDNTVTLTIVDNSGNISQCTAIVTVSGLDADNDGVTTCDGDCDDNDPANYPGNTEICDGQDNNCDGIIDEGFDVDGDGVTSCGGDCDDNDPNNYPGNTEVCDGQDNNCDGITDEGFVDTDGDGMANCVDPDDDNDGCIDSQDVDPLVASQPLYITGCPDDIVLCGSQNVTWTAPVGVYDCTIPTITNSHDPGDFFDVGTTTVTYSFTDVTGNTVICRFDVVIQELPDLSINQRLVPDFCQGITVLEVVANNGGNLAGSLDYTWDASSENEKAIIVYSNGVYNVTVTDGNGCVGSASTTVDVVQSDILSGYNTLGAIEVKFKEAIMSGGGAGVINVNKKAKFEKNTVINTFGKAPVIEIKGGSTVVEEIIGQADVPLPVFRENPDNTNNNITVSAGTTMTLTGNSYGKILVKEDATLIFDAPEVFVKEIITKKNATIDFLQTTEIMIEKNLDIDKDNIVNTSALTVIFYIEGKLLVDEGTDFTANVYAKNIINIKKANENNRTTMTGLFITLDKVDSREYVDWNWSYDCSLDLTPALPMLSQTQPSETEGTHTQEEGMVITSQTTETGDFKIYPNPAHETANIHLIGMEDASRLTIYDQFGKIVLQRQIESGQDEMKISLSEHQLVSGLYLVEKISGEKRSVKRLIITQ